MQCVKYSNAIFSVRLYEFSKILYVCKQTNDSMTYIIYVNARCNLWNMNRRIIVHRKIKIIRKMLFDIIAIVLPSRFSVVDITECFMMRKRILLLHIKRSLWFYVECVKSRVTLIFMNFEHLNLAWTNRNEFISRNKTCARKKDGENFRDLAL